MTHPSEQDQIKKLLAEIADFNTVAHALSSAEENAASAITAVVVDDDAEAAAEMADCISSAGVRCLAATSACEASAIIDREENARILVTDLKMPGTNGLELVRALNERPDRDLHCIMVSGHSAIHDLQAAMHENVREFLTKPLDCESLVAGVTRLRDEILARRGQDTGLIYQE